MVYYGTLSHEALWTEAEAVLTEYKDRLQSDTCEDPSLGLCSAKKILTLRSFCFSADGFFCVAQQLL